MLFHVWFGSLMNLAQVSKFKRIQDILFNRFLNRFIHRSFVLIRVGREQNIIYFLVPGYHRPRLPSEEFPTYNKEAPPLRLRA